MGWVHPARTPRKCRAWIRKKRSPVVRKQRWCRPQSSHLSCGRCGWRTSRAPRRCPASAARLCCCSRHRSCTPTSAPRGRGRRRDGALRAGCARRCRCMSLTTRGASSRTCLCVDRRSSGGRRPPRPPTGHRRSRALASRACCCCTKMAARTATLRSRWWRSRFPSARHGRAGPRRGRWWSAFASPRSISSS
ncbi:hypothetical protein STCU_11603 [Strigomonas culicis]|uniref:Uncharacterized protein n=1 Tax=Strigomonas culicis TaxID=28005 RepID=S9UZS2_9TRYP|nr:hypothetical protein STCU_11603 [Strigomonas culicis]|eukprot:EPY16025.1 hypothetical protein STCU_11603 [Strigomonas culicis]